MYAPNLIHQGASVITKISSANGYKNLASPNSYEVTHGQKISQKNSQRVKTMQLVQKLKGSMKTQSAHAHAQNKNARFVHIRMMCDCC
jgi:hypothetical protein